jgi:hypothetical protein
MNLQQNIYDKEKFQTAEQLWFWFLYSKQIKNGISKNNFSFGKRICEVLDIEILITKLYLSGKLTDEQLSVMKEFGDKRRSPHQYIWKENKSVALWNTAMQTINAAARHKGWIED